MKRYNPKIIESKWQKYWAKNSKLSFADEKSKKPKFFCLDMFPYPSGDGLHVGHVESYTASDIYSRYQRMNGKNVLHPMGWDAFGLPAENYAIKTGTHPARSTQKNIKNFTRQIKSLGLSYDWSREIDTSSPEYYKWTQWFFLFLYKHGLAYRKKAKVNWCESCKTVLANEQVEDGRCERCKNEVVQKDLEQWFFKITDFADDLISGLDKIDWPESTKTAQKNWIGKSEGATVKFSISNSQNNSKFKIQNSKFFIEVFTTRLDTIYGCTYCVVAPEHKVIEEIRDKIENIEEVEKYVMFAKKKTDLQRTDLQKSKTGVELKGVKAINPFTKEAVPIFVADYVLSTYGTGAVMAVPAHDERDFEFAKKYKLPIRQVILPKEKVTVGIGALIKLKSGKYLFQERDGKAKVSPGMIAPFGGGIKPSESSLGALKRELKEEIKVDIDISKVSYIGKFASDNFPGKYIDIFYIDEINEKSLKIREGKSLAKLTLNKALKNSQVTDFTKRVIKFFSKQLNHAFTDDGILINSGKYSKLISEKAREEMAAWLEKNKLGEKTTTYKLRDWLISRQRYWGAPIPIIYCSSCHSRESGNPGISSLRFSTGSRVKPGMTKHEVATIDRKEYAIVPVPEKDLPVKLPTDVDFRPKGESPLKLSKKFHDVKCPVCGEKAIRESDTMDTFVCSSWYYFRYADPKNKKEFAAKSQIKKWLPVDLYIGGAEHVVLHLLYSRFFTKALHRYKHIHFDEPFQKLRHQGMVLAEDGRKMSKSLGNVINPDAIVKEYGADVLRLYEMFMGPLEDSKAWNTKSIVGLKRFLERIWKLKSVISDQGSVNNNLEKGINKTIKKITEDIENLRFNTAISALMILLNEFEKQNKLFTVHCSLFTKLLSPFAPHIAEEIWSDLGHKTSIFLEKWPKFNPKLAREDEITLIIQVNGKVRGELKVPAGIGEREAKDAALELEKIQKYIPNTGSVRKIIFVPNRLINFVV